MFWVLGSVSQTVDDRRRCGQIRIADAEIDNIHALRNRGLFHLIDGGKEIGRQGLNSACDFDRETGHVRDSPFLDEA